MVRSLWSRPMIGRAVQAAVAGLALTGFCLAADPPQVPRVLMVQEKDKPAQRCVVVKSWVDRDGNHLSTVQNLATGEQFTLLDPSGSKPGAPWKARIFRGNVPATTEPPASLLAQKSPVISSATVTEPNKPAVIASADAKKTEQPRKPTLLGWIFGSGDKKTDEKKVVAVAEPAPVSPYAPVETGPPAPDDWRKSWGHAERWQTKDTFATSRPESSAIAQLPHADTTGGDPCLHPERFAEMALERENKKRSGATPLAADTSPANVKPSGPATSTPIVSARPAVAAAQTTGQVPIPVQGSQKTTTVAANAPVVDYSPEDAPLGPSYPVVPGMQSGAPQRITAMPPAAPPQPEENTKPKSSWSLASLFSPRKPHEVKKDPTPATEAGPATQTVSATQVPQARQTAPAPQAGQAGKRGVEAITVPAGYGSVVAAAEAENQLAADQAQAAAQSVTAAHEMPPTPNAFSEAHPLPGMPAPYGPPMSAYPAMPPSPIGYAMPPISVAAGTPPGMVNAFTAARDSRPIPADFGSPAYVPGAFSPQPAPEEGLGAPPSAERMAAAMSPPGHATASSYIPASEPALPANVIRPVAAAESVVDQAVRALRESLLPSEREWAVERLSKCDWQSDYVILQALLSAAREDPAASVRTACVRALVRMKARSPAVVSTLEALNADPDIRVRKAAEQALPGLR
jgi:hypothetical protein